MPLDAFHEEKGTTETEFLKIIREQQNSKLTKGWTHGFIDRYHDEIQVSRSPPHEDM
jgi:hypothetical protein